MLYYLQILFRSLVSTSLLGVLFQNLSRRYGPIFSNDSNILPLAIALSVSPSWWSSISTSDASRERTLYYEWLSSFHMLMGRDLQESNVDETHLFAMFWVSQIHWCLYEVEDSRASRIYAVGFAMILRHLYGSRQSGTRSKPFSLPAVWPWMLSVLRGNECFPEIPIDHFEDSTIDFRWDLHRLYELIGPVDECLLEYPSLEVYKFRHQLSDINLSLKTCLLVFLQPRRVGLNMTRERTVEVEESMRNLRAQVEKVTGCKRALDAVRVMVQKPLDIYSLIISTVCRYQKSISG